MDANHHQEQQLWNYIDGTLDESARTELEQLIRTDAQWSNKYRELLECHQLIGKHIRADQPSLRFTRNVMEEIARLNTPLSARNYLNTRVTRSIAIFFAAAILALIGSALVYVDPSATAAGTVTDLVAGVNQTGLLGTPLINIVVFINIILGMMLADLYFKPGIRRGHK